LERVKSLAKRASSIGGKSDNHVDKFRKSCTSLLRRINEKILIGEDRLGNDNGNNNINVTLDADRLAETKDMNPLLEKMSNCYQGLRKSESVKSVKSVKSVNSVKSESSHLGK